MPFCDVLPRYGVPLWMTTTTLCCRTLSASHSQLIGFVTGQPPQPHERVARAMERGTPSGRCAEFFRPSADER